MRKALTFFLQFTLFVCAVNSEIFALTLSPIGDESNENEKNGFVYRRYDDGYFAEAVIVRYTGNETKLTIPDKIGDAFVTGIAESAFEKKSMVEVFIPNSVTTIGDSAFAGCTRLTVVRMSENLTILPVAVFEDCSSLSSFSFPPGLTAIRSRAFAGCGTLQEARIPAQVSYIATDSFFDCDGLRLFAVDVHNPFFNSVDGLLVDERSKKILRFPGGKTSEYTILPIFTEIGEHAFAHTKISAIEFTEKITKIGVGAFSLCKNIAAITLPTGITEIGAEAFAGCTALKSLELPPNVRLLGDGAFSGCSGLETIALSESSIEHFGINIFEACSSLAAFSFPAAYTAIPAGMFKDCTALKEIALSQTVTKIGEAAFSGCTSFRTFDLPEKLEQIGKNAFKNCTGIFFIEIPKTVTDVGRGAFSGCIFPGKINFDLSAQYGGGIFAAT